MAENKGTETGGRRTAAFLLAQLGAHAASRFAARLAVLDLIPAHAGLFRMLASVPGLTQRELATALDTLPSRIVLLLDTLEARGLVERRQHDTDRRRHALHLTAAGDALATEVGRIARAHQAALLQALSDEEQDVLAALLQRIADQQQLIRNVHPGYRSGQRAKPIDQT